MPYAKEQQCEAELLRCEHRLVVRLERPWLSETFDGVEEDAQERDGALVAQ